jgi:hypothetical protein
MEDRNPTLLVNTLNVSEQNLQPKGREIGKMNKKQNLKTMAQL